MVHGYYLTEDSRQDQNNLCLTFSSKSLEKLSFKLHKYLDSETMIKSIHFNTPKMSSLVFWKNYASVERKAEFPVYFRFPLKIRHLECIEFNSDMSALKNLETLICQKIVGSFSLSDFRSLRRLELFPREQTELDLIRAIIEEKAILGRKQLVILVCGFQDLPVVCRTEIHYLVTSFELEKNYLEQVAKHPDNFVGHIPWEFHLKNFPSFYRISKELPKDFLRKFAQFERIEVSGNSRRSKRRALSPDPSDVLQLLIQAEPEDVDIKYNFNKPFYERLVSIQSIIRLGVKDKYENLDYDLFLKLRYLQDLYISTEKLEIAFVARLFTEMKFIDSFFYFFSNFRIGIREMYSDERKYYFFYQNVPTRKEPLDPKETYFDALGDLIEHLEKLKNENPSYLRNCLL